jgi:hypothetical protein
MSVFSVRIDLRTWQGWIAVIVGAAAGMLSAGLTFRAIGPKG